MTTGRPRGSVPAAARTAVGEPRARNTAGRAIGRTAARAAVIGIGSVTAGFAVSLIAVAAGWLGGPGATESVGRWLHDGGLFLALPCAVIAWGLAAWSLHLTRGLAMGARQFSLVLWGAATSTIYGFAVMLWLGLSSGDWAGGGFFWSATTLIGLCDWLITLTPAFIMLIARPLLARDPATTQQPPGQPAVYGAAEREEDIETGAEGARASLREVFGRDA